MIIKNLFRTKDPASKVKCFFTVETSRFTINDCKLCVGKDSSLFVAMPSKEYTDRAGVKKWQSTVILRDDDLRNRITQAALAAYGGEEQPAGPAEDPGDLPF